MKEKPEAKLWQIKIEKAEEIMKFYVVSRLKPILIPESYFGKFRRLFEIAHKGEQPQPVFFINREDKVEVEEVAQMYGFKLNSITEKYITLEVENLENKGLYEIFLFNPQVRGLFKLEYVFAKDKKEAANFAKKFKRDYQVSVRKTDKIACYPINFIGKDRIVLERKL